MVSNTVSEVIYTGNASTSTGYSVDFQYLDSGDVKVQTIAQGTGTVSISGTTATFSTAQTTLATGDRIRIAGINYTILSKASSTVYQLTVEATVGASSFHILDNYTDLVEGSTFTLVEVGVGAPYVTTNPAIPATALVRVFRRLEYVQPEEFPTAGQLPSETIERMGDRLVMQIQQLAAALEAAGVITAGSGVVTLLDTTSFANDAARTSTTPGRLYQIGVQIDTKTIYYGSSLTPGGWTQTTFKERVLTDPATDAPLYIGELATFKGATIGNKYAPGIYKGTGTSAGNWELCIPNRLYDSWQATPWNDTEALDRGQIRMAGHSGLYRWADRVSFAVAKPGMGSLVVRPFTSDSLGGRDVLLSNLAITSTEGTSTSVNGGLVDPGFGPVGSTQVMNYADRIYVEIVSAGLDALFTTSAQSFTFADADLTQVGTGTWIDAVETSNGGQNGIALSVSTFGVTRSHPAESNLGSYRLNGRIFARGLSGTWQGQQNVINSITATDTSLIRPGDRVIGPTVHPDCRVDTISSTSFTMTHPLLGDTFLVGVINEDRPPVQHFIGLSETTGATTIDVADTTLIAVGDSVIGTNIAADSIVLSKLASSFTTTAITGNIDNVTVVPPRRVAQITADTSNISCTTTGLLVGQKVTGPGVPPDTFITNVQIGLLTVNNLLSMNISGSSTDIIEVTREELEITGSPVSGSSSVTLPYSVSTTGVDVNYSVYYIEGPGIQPGTFVTGAGGSAITLNKPAGLSVSNVKLRLYRPSRWKGLSIAIAGRHYAGTT